MIDIIIMHKSNEMQFKSIIIAILVIFSNIAVANTTYKVRNTDNLSKIIKAHYNESKLKKSQLMIGVLNANPKAFRFGNINALRSGQLLSLPDVTNLKLMDVDQAQKLIVEHSKHFRKKSKQPIKSSFQNNVSNTDKTTTLTMMQQDKLRELKKLESERAELIARMDKLIEESDQTDIKLQEINNELEK